MLQIQNIRKQYITGDLTQVALNDVSLNLRDNEFVAILGPSGSGKTTLLNIIGGLDRYDSGDLIINGISTKQYKDRDWDSYRNHTIGFVFQSYNLIPHQTVLANVELALTISGISRAERRQRAKQALEAVGLGEQIHKKPNQMSGGQMQRVAIARALVNDPDIVLADEPTGALDSETSIQVMELLKQVAKDRLVVMVTHNPELAEQYATRIVRLKDGSITDDSMPFTVDETAMEAPEHKNMGRASMSFLTSLLLSFNNLLTKKGRTILTAFAGSIGIIGIALILSLSNGANTYIRSVEEETLSEYPLTIQSASMDISALMQGAASSRMEEVNEGEVREWKTLSAMLSRVSSNDLTSLRKHLETDVKEEMDRYARAIEYSYDITPQIFRLTGKDTYRQVNPDQALATALGNSYNIASSFMNQNAFNPLPEDEDLFIDQYDVLEGHWPKNKDEVVVVLTEDNRLTDLALYSLGLKDAAELDEMVEKFYKNEPTDTVSEDGVWKIEEIVGVECLLVDPADFYVYDPEYNVYVKKTDNSAYMLEKVKEGMPLTVVGVVRPKDDSNATMLTSGIYYHHDLINYISEQAAASDIVQKQLADPERDVFTGNLFSETVENTMDMSSLFSIDEEALAKAFQFDEDAFKDMDFSDLELDFSGMDLSGIDLSGIDLSNLDFSNLDFSGMEPPDLSSILANLDIQVDPDAMQNLFTTLIAGYLEEASKDPATDYSRIGEAAGEYLNSEAARTILQEQITSILQPAADAMPGQADVQELMTDIISGFGDYIQDREITDISEISDLLNEYINSEAVQTKVSDFASRMQESFDQIQVTPEQLAQVTGALYQGYEDYAKENTLPDPSRMMDSFAQYLSGSEGQQVLMDGISKAVNMDDLSSQLASAMEGVFSDYAQKIGTQITSAITQAMGQAMNQIMSQVSGEIASQLTSVLTEQMGQMMEQVSEKMQNAFNIDVDAFTGAIKISMDPEELQELMVSMMSADTASYEGNLKKLNYADMAKPSVIAIYPRDFESKGKILNILDTYNADMKQSGQEEKVISYTDYVGTLMSSVTDIIDTISYVLVAFVAISLIVSSIMIGIITYISVLERTKEIGILRAIGASKRNISQVFNAETFIIGLLSGVIGIGVTLLLLIPINAIIHSLAGNTTISAILPAAGGVALIIISVILTLIGGLIPSRKAAKKDPVTALRTE